MYLDAMKQAEVFNDAVVNACYNAYGDKGADVAMQDFADKYRAMMDELNKLFLVSVVENMADKGSTQI